MCEAPTGGVVRKLYHRAAADFVVGDHDTYESVATQAVERASGFSGVAHLFIAIIPFDINHVEIHHFHRIPNHRAVARFILLHPCVIWRTWVYKKNNIVICYTCALAV